MNDFAAVASSRTGRLAPLLTVWGARVAWLAVAVVGGRAVGDAVADRSGAVQLAATGGAWVGWAAGAVALAAPSTAALTAARAVVPGALAATVAASAGGAGMTGLLVLGVPAVVASVLILAAETGGVFVQASAYGDENRFPLRPPLGYLAATIVSWIVWVTAVIAMPLAWAAGAWAPAVAVTLVAVAGSAVLPRRWHQLSRRWLVAVPAGLVVHDPVVLAETLMLPRRHVAAVAAVAPAARPDAIASDAVDLTGPTPGVALQIRLREAATVVLAPRPGQSRGRALHVTSLLVSPSRPGAALSTFRRRHLPVR